MESWTINMHLSRSILVGLLSFSGAFADFLGPKYPAPVDLTSNKSSVSAAWEKLTSLFDDYLIDGNTTVDSSLTTVEKLTFSVGLFSLHDPAVKQLQYHHTGSEIANARNGTHKVDEDSIYRIASISKLFTVFAGMISLTDEDWNRPLTKTIPGLVESAGRGEQNPIYSIQWDKITPWALAAQSAGLPYLAYPSDDSVLRVPPRTSKFGFPPVDPSSWGGCWDVASTPTCPADDYIENIRSYLLSFLPWTTSAYSSDGFALLGLTISNITGKPMEVVYRESIFEPLGMTSSDSKPATGEAKLAHSVIAGDLADYLASDAVIIPSGGLFSTIKDLTKLGLAILNSTLIPPTVTHKWMKPITHTASLSYSIGAPWEIMRYVHPYTGKVTDLYTKLGDSGAYTGTIVLIPDYDAGFTLQSAHSNSTMGRLAATTVIDHVTNAVLPALEAQAQAESGRDFVGSYISTDSKLNSSVTIALNESTAPGASPALSITSWISNGTDVLSGPFFGGTKPRLLLTIPNQSPDGAAGKVAFQASVNPQTNSYLAAEARQLGAIGPFTGLFATNLAWATVDAAFYAGLAVNKFIFDVDDKGRATAVSPVVTRAILKRKG